MCWLTCALQLQQLLIRGAERRDSHQTQASERSCTCLRLCRAMKPPKLQICQIDKSAKVGPLGQWLRPNGPVTPCNSTAPIQLYIWYLLHLAAGAAPPPSAARLVIACARMRRSKPASLSSSSSSAAAAAAGAFLLSFASRACRMKLQLTMPVLVS